MDPGGFVRSVVTVRDRHLRIPPDEGNAHLVQFAVRLSVIGLLVIALGAAVGVTTMMMLNDWLSLLVSPLGIEPRTY